jgi:hypothetical protein
MGICMAPKTNEGPDNNPHAFFAGRTRGQQGRTGLLHAFFIAYHAWCMMPSCIFYCFLLGRLAFMHFFSSCQSIGRKKARSIGRFRVRTQCVVGPGSTGRLAGPMRHCDAVKPKTDLRWADSACISIVRGKRKKRESAVQCSTRIVGDVKSDVSTLTDDYDLKIYLYIYIKKYLYITF